MSRKITLPPLDTRDVGRILSGLRERKRKLDKGIAKFGDDFDAEKGANMLDARDSYGRLIKLIEKETNDA
jgi:hypothetical protein